MRIFAIILLFITLSGGALAQDPVKGDTTTSKTYFQQARDLAFAGQYEQSRAICRQIMKKDTGYYDAMVLAGRTYAWEQKYDSARLMLEKVVKKKKNHYDALDALTDVGIWSGKYEDALNNANKALLSFPEDTSFMYRKGLALYNLERYKEALEPIDRMLAKFPKSARALALKELILEALRVNRISVHFIYDFFNPRMDPWRLTYVEYIRKTKGGTWIGRLNYGHRFNRNGIMVEADAYPKLNDKTYFYLNAGVSSGKVFPSFRAAAEIFQKLPNAFEVSLGFRYLQYDSVQAMIYTGSVAKYYKNTWFCFRPYLSPIEGGLSTSFTLTFRYYYKTADDFFSVLVGTGSYPDNRNLQIDQSVMSLRSQNFYVEYQRRVSPHFIVKGIFGYAHEEYYVKKYRSRNTIGAGVYYVF